MKNFETEALFALVYAFLSPKMLHLAFPACVGRFFHFVVFYPGQNVTIRTEKLLSLYIVKKKKNLQASIGENIHNYNNNKK